MKSDFDNAMLATGKLMQKGRLMLAENVGKTVALITAAVTLLVTFTDVGFGSFTAEGFTSEAGLLLISSYLMYFSLSESGQRLGRQSEEYLSLRQTNADLRDRVGGEMIDDLRGFCREYSDSELNYRRLRAMADRGLSNSDPDSLSPAERRMLKKIDRMRPIRLTPSDLLSDGGGDRRTEEFCATGRARLARAAASLLPSTVCMIFTVSVMLSAKEGLTPTGVIESLLKLSTLPIIGLRGYADGYNLATVTEVSRLRMRIRLLGAFLKKYGEN